jgi:galactokinase
MSDNERRTRIAAEFIRRFGGAPTIWVRAPGRVDLMGSHTDYNQGYVLTLSIDHDIWIALRPRTDRRVAVQSLNVEGGAEFALDAIEHDYVAPWSNYVRGVAQVFHVEGYAPSGFDGLIDSTVPTSSGLSSSAALEAATAMAFQALSGWTIDKVRLALLCQRAENQFVGVNCGILDQYSSILGQAGTALLLDCRHLASQAQAVPEGILTVICDTRARRELTGSEYPERRAQCEEGARRLAQFYPGVTALRDVTLEQFLAHEADLPPVVARRCRFIIQENQRVLDLAAALPADDRGAIRRLTAESYAGARDLYEIGVPQMEAMIRAMRAAPGFIGGRQAGAGFGGCMVACVEAAQGGAFAAHVQARYREATGIETRIYPVRPAPGAGVLP